MKVVVFGLGYVGTVTAAGLASSGHQVIGVDVDTGKVEAVRAGRSPVVEPDVESLIADSVTAGRLTATTDPRTALANAEVSLICVGTPSGAHGETDLSFVSRALADVRDSMVGSPPPDSGFHSVVIRSTVPPGTGESVVDPVFRETELPAGWEVGTAMCPEFLREGSSVRDFFDPPFVVVGTEAERTKQSLAALFAFLDQELMTVDVGTAEALKFACNAFHATKVSFANEMGRVFRPYGIDSREVMRLFCLDSKLNISPVYLRPGFAYGGSCLPKDLRSLQHMARINDVDIPLLAGTSLSNELVIRDVLERVIATGERKICIFGLSFKNDTDDLRESPTVELAERLIGKGFDVTVYDPILNPDKLIGANRRHMQAKLPHLHRLLARTPQAALRDAGVMVVASSDPEMLGSLVETPPKHVFDLHGRLSREVELLPGYEGVGW